MPDQITVPKWKGMEALDRNLNPAVSGDQEESYIAAYQ
jgi:hypothetical protein